MVNMKKRKVKGLQGVSNSSKKKRREDEISEGDFAAMFLFTGIISILT